MHKISIPSFLGQSLISESRRRDLARDYSAALREERLRAMLEVETDEATAAELRRALALTVRTVSARRF